MICLPLPLQLTLAGCAAAVMLPLPTAALVPPPPAPVRVYPTTASRLPTSDPRMVLSTTGTVVCAVHSKDARFWDQVSAEAAAMARELRKREGLTAELAEAAGMRLEDEDDSDDHCPTCHRDYDDFPRPHPGCGDYVVEGER